MHETAGNLARPSTPRSCSYWAVQRHTPATAMLPSVVSSQEAAPTKTSGRPTTVPADMSALPCLCLPLPASPVPAEHRRRRGGYSTVPVRNGDHGPAVPGRRWLRARLAPTHIVPARLDLLQCRVFAERPIGRSHVLVVFHLTSCLHPVGVSSHSGAGAWPLVSPASTSTKAPLCSGFPLLGTGECQVPLLVPCSPWHGITHSAESSKVQGA